jgi:hypothetical protein
VIFYEGLFNSSDAICSKVIVSQVVEIRKSI